MFVVAERGRCSRAFPARPGLNSPLFSCKTWLNSPAAASHIGNITGNAKAAAADYRRYCVGCHGEMGDGNGENTPWLDPKPRDFHPWRYSSAAPRRRAPCPRTKICSTPSRAVLTARTCRSGAPSPKLSAPIWWHGSSTSLPAGRTKNLALRSRSLPSRKSPPERVKAGQEVFGRVQCWKCHGVQGMANGPSASTLTDDLGRPIAPYNFTDGTRPKCGDTDRDIYRIFMTGLDGTPMPSFADNIKPDEAWDLVFICVPCNHTTHLTLRKKRLPSNWD